MVNGVIPGTVTAMRYRLAVAGVLVALAPTALVACGSSEKATESFIEEAIGGDVQVDDNGNVSISGDDFEVSSGEDVGLPSGFPSDVPTPAGDARLTTSYSGNDGMYSLVYSTDNWKPVTNAYLDDLEAAGFDEEVASTSADFITGSFVGKGWRVTAYGTDGTVNVTVEPLSSTSDTSASDTSTSDTSTSDTGN